MFQIEIEYADGDKDVFISDENTKWHESPRIYNNIYFGEIYDARKESIGWREKDFEDWIGNLQVKQRNQAEN